MSDIVKLQVETNFKEYTVKSKTLNTTHVGLVQYADLFSIEYVIFLDHTP